MGNRVFKARNEEPHNLPVTELPMTLKLIEKIRKKREARKGMAAQQKETKGKGNKMKEEWNDHPNGKDSEEEAESEAESYEKKVEVKATKKDGRGKRDLGKKLNGSDDEDVADDDSYEELEEDSNENDDDDSSEDSNTEEDDDESDENDDDDSSEDSNTEEDDDESDENDDDDSDEGSEEDSNDTSDNDYDSDDNEDESEEEPKPKPEPKPKSKPMPIRKPRLYHRNDTLVTFIFFFIFHFGSCLYIICSLKDKLVSSIESAVIDVS
ncbi:expressed conserved protein [Echinococcus multilocularis]|uniref:Expressed conserved protein n=1 Tax=Echinococcus multilocularis TaxID=6211 RepID=A0A068YD49_ECHMU|nr:expressed conserved protein [Echinococcus multilocularis]